MNNSDPAVTYEFGKYRLDTRRLQLLTTAGQPVTLTSRVYDALLYFVEHRGELLDKGKLMQAIWPDTVVEENNLNQVISTLRKALGEKAGDYRYVITEPGRGYRFVAEVNTISEKGIQAISSEVTGLLTIAVLPFANLSSDPEQEYFADGISEELLNRLSKLRGLQVTGRTSSFYFKNRNEDFQVIGEKLGVAHILEGSIRKAGNRVRIATRLIKTADGYQLWGESYDRTLEDIFAIQDEIAQSVADALQITLGVGEIGRVPGMTRNIAAYDAYLTGLSHYNRVNNSQAIEALEKAVALDPDFSIAWALLSVAYGDAAWAFQTERAEEYLQKQNEAVARASSLTPDSVTSLIAATWLYIRHREWVSAEQTVDKMLDIAPASFNANRAKAFLLTNVGRAREALDYAQRASEIDPLSIYPMQALVLAYDFTGKFDKALELYERMQGLDGNFAPVNSVLLRLAMGMHDKALICEVSEKVGSNTLQPASGRTIDLDLVALLDFPEQALQYLYRLDENPDYKLILPRVAMAAWSSYYGDDDFALRLFNDISESYAFATWLLWRTVHKKMRRLPGFKNLVTKLGLVDYWRTTGNWGDFCRPVGKDNFECI